MSTVEPFPLVAVDIGNSRIKLGLFERRGTSSLPEPVRSLHLKPGRESLDGISNWLSPLSLADVSWQIASVNRAHVTELVDWLRRRLETPRVSLLSSRDLPLVIRLPRPDMVGIDRLVGAVAANHLREPGAPAVVVCMGSAITANLVGEDGAFLGGSILPGIGMSARAMHQFTDMLPLLDMASLAEPPSPLGTDTVAAMQSGLFWGAVGGVRELIARFSRDQSRPPQVFLTGGAAPSVAGLLTTAAVYLPHLLLSGIAIAADVPSPQPAS